MDCSSHHHATSIFWIQRVCAAVVLCATLLFVILSTRGNKLRLSEYRGSFSLSSKAELFLDQENGPTRYARLARPLHKLHAARTSRGDSVVPFDDAASAFKALRVRMILPSASQDSYADLRSRVESIPSRTFIIESEEDARKMARLHATRKNELLFTTYTFTHKGHYSYDAIYMATHMWENLREVELLSHTIILSYDAHSCQVMWENGIPCFLDRWLPQPSDLPGQYGSDVPHWYQKYAWALQFIKFGYTTLFMELDMIFFENPLPYYNPELDLEGLSDWPVTELGTPKERFTGPCTVYHMQKGDNNDQYLDWGGNRPDDLHSQYHINPCMSTGFWFIQPRQAAKDFLEGFIDLELNWRNWQTDQRLWNEVIMAYLIGHGQQPPLKFSLLNTTRFCNFGVDEIRKERGQTTHPVMLHGGAFRSEEKEPFMRSRGYWKAEQWQKEGAADHILSLSQHFERQIPY